MSSPTRYSATAEVSGFVGGGPINAVAVCGHNANAAIRYLQLHNKASAVANAEVPVLTFMVPASGGNTVFGNDFFTQDGLRFSLGLAYGWSTTRDTYTAASAADHSVTILYA